MTKFEKITEGNDGGVVLTYKTNIGAGMELAVDVSKEQIIEIINASNAKEEILAKIQEEKNIGEEKRENYESLQPTGFEFAPAKAKKYRADLELAKDAQQMKFLQETIAYNKDGTKELLKIDETFCSDLTGNGASMNWDDSMELATSKGYHLLSDWNLTDSDQVKEKTDWYRLIDTFGKYANQGALSCMLDFDNARYWTGTPHKNEKGIEVKGGARTRNPFHSNRYWDVMKDNNCVCGFKNKD